MNAITKAEAPRQLDEVEEAMERLGFAVRDAVHARRSVFGMPLEHANKNWAKDKAALAVIKSFIYGKRQ